MCPYSIGIANPVNTGFERIYVGCGKCGACKHNKRVDWSFRIMQEAKYSKSAYFITLTYHDSVIPYTENWLQTLRKEDVQEFNKKVRKEQAKRCKTYLRFFCVGEYGTKFQRPHYHIIYFNLLPDLSDPAELLPLWKKGIVHRYPIEDGLIHYTTKYHVTANNGQRRLSPSDDRALEFTRMSLKPGLGYQYIEKTRDFHLKSKITVVRNNGYIQKMPDYYRRKIFGDLPEAEKEQLRADGLEMAQEAHDKEIVILRKEGFYDPERELLERQVYASKQVFIKAKRKGVF